MTTQTPLPRTQVYYPDTDGQPMAESDFQRIPLSYAVEALDLYFEDRPDVYVSGNIFLYFQEGDPTANVAPDVLVVFGVRKAERRSYKLWEEGGKAPDFILEITSETTRVKDQGVKFGLYAALGVREYLQYDPTGDYLSPPLKGWRLVGDHYEALPTQALNGTLVVVSEVLGLEARAELIRREFRFYDPKTGQRLLSRKESERGRLAAEARAAQEAAARREAEERAAQEAAARREAEERAAQEAAARREAEERAAALAAEMERLRAELDRRARGSEA